MPSIPSVRNSISYEFSLKDCILRIIWYGKGWLRREIKKNATGR
jgi:hypothetical protein